MEMLRVIDANLANEFFLSWANEFLTKKTRGF